MSSSTGNPKVWNKEFEAILEERCELSHASGMSARKWKSALEQVSTCDEDIVLGDDDSAVNHPDTLKPTVRQLCTQVMVGVSRYRLKNPFDNDKYTQRIKIRSGSYAILMAFHHSDKGVMSKSQIIEKTKPYCDSEMEFDHHMLDSKGFAAWNPGIKTLQKKEFIKRSKGGSKGDSFELTICGKYFVDALLRKNKRALEEAKRARNPSLKRPAETVSSAPIDATFSSETVSSAPIDDTSSSSSRKGFITSFFGPPMKKQKVVKKEEK